MQGENRGERGRDEEGTAREGYMKGGEDGGKRNNERGGLIERKVKRVERWSKRKGEGCRDRESPQEGGREN